MFFRVLLVSIILFSLSFVKAQTTDLLISEYVEGSSNNKYIEIYNGTGASINLNDYQLRLYSNGSTTPSNTNTLSGTLANNSVIVYKNSGATIYGGTATNATAVGFNGDDAIALFKISTNSFVDIFGNIGCDPGSAWTLGGNTTANKTLVRNVNVCSGITTDPTGCGTGSFPTLGSEWTEFNQDDISNLGSHTNSCITPCVAPVTQPTNLVLSNITSSSIQGTFTGNGSDAYLVVASTNPTLSANPNNTTSYTVGNALGGGTVVHNGSATTFTATGLTPSTTYYFFIFAYNNTGCSGGPLYNITNPLTNNGTTLVPPPFTANVVVSEYFNASDPRDEWIELVVITDNTDMRNWTLRDNNSSTNSWQTPITFQNIPFWNNMRGGTIIKIWNRRRSSSSAAIRVIEVNKDDGYVELYASNSTYFSGGNFGSSPSYAGSTLNYANGGDILQLRNSSGTHVHAMGHDLSPGSSWTGCPTPKVLRNENMNANESVRVVGNTTANYDGGSTTSNTVITKGTTGITSGLANDANNELLWRTWREPDITTQNIAGNTCGASCVNFTWNKMTDPLPSDDVQGYLILRKTTTQSFTAPTDGTSYAALSLLGTATVVANLDNPTTGTTVTYTDNLAAIGTDEYRIYGYRYTDDNTNGNSFDLARGRAYNITDFVTVTLPPLPIKLLYFKGKTINESNLLEWTTTSEINNDYFTIEKSTDAVNFSNIGTVSGAGNSNINIDYSFVDDNLTNSTNYYRLKQTDFDGKYSYSNIVVLSNDLSNNVVYNNTTNQLEIGDIKNGTVNIYNLQGQVVKSITANNSTVSINLSKGMYLIAVQTENEVFSKKIVVN